MSAPAKSAKRVLVPISSVTQMSNGTPTGTWLEELATPYMLMKEAGFELVLASPAGNDLHFDQGSMGDATKIEACKQFLALQEAKQLEIRKLSDVIDASFDGVFVPGGHSLCWDLPLNARSLAC